MRSVQHRRKGKESGPSHTTETAACCQGDLRNYRSLRVFTAQTRAGESQTVTHLDLAVRGRRISEGERRPTGAFKGLEKTSDRKEWKEH